MPELADIWNVLLLRDYNTRLVVISTILLGCACGLMGGFLLLRKRSLMGDTLSHATLPGVGLAFMLALALGGDGKSLPLLLSGAAITGLIGCAAVLFIREQTRIKDDAAMGIVLSVFFGAGVSILGVIQTMPEGSAAGLESFIYGKTASMVMSDFQVLVLVTVCVITCSLLLFKEFRLLCFDETFAAALGWPVKFLDILLLALITAVTVAGLQAVGLILIIAFLITPAAAARFWTNQLARMLLLSALIGAASAWLGASLSAFFPRLPAGAGDRACGGVLFYSEYADWNGAWPTTSLLATVAL
jgi:manganese/zinc/iron transport system permease protein